MTFSPVLSMSVLDKFSVLSVSVLEILPVLSFCFLCGQNRRFSRFCPRATKLPPKGGIVPVLSKTCHGEKRCEGQGCPRKSFSTFP